MTKQTNDNLSSTAVWRSRQEALLQVAKEILPARPTAPPVGDQSETGTDLQEALEKETITYGQPLAEPFQTEYERQQRTTTRTLLRLLKAFIDKGSAYLEKAGDRVDGYARRYLWRELLNEASADLQIIEAAYEQRLPEGGRRLSLTSSLFTADILSEHALGQAVDNDLLPPTPVITFLQGKVTVRPIPYADVVLVSVAYASMLEPATAGENKEAGPRVSRDLLAIPHEIGHHIFWHAHLPGQKQLIYTQLRQRLDRAGIWEWDWRRSWLEEIFADIYGLLVAGPLMALSFQDLLTDDPPADFLRDNGDHPIPALRPFIHSCILRAISDSKGQPVYERAPDLLDERWQAIVAGIFSHTCVEDDPLQTEYNIHGLAQPLSGARILQALDEPLNIILQTLRAQRPSGADAGYTHGNWRPWTAGLEDGQDLADLYQGLNLDNFPLESRWLRYPEVEARENKDVSWPDLILGGWSVKGPEDRGGG